MSTPVTTLVNGEPSASVPTTDRGLQYGDGVFETIAIEAGVPRHWQHHLGRLKAGCERLDIPAPADVRLQEESAQLINGVDRGVLKLIVTRGSGGRGYAPPASATPARILQLHPWPAYPDACTEEGVRARLCTTRLGRNPALAGIKHLNRLEQVLARKEWSDTNIREGLMMDANENLVEGTMSNLFLVLEGMLVTPDLSECGVAGIMRTIVIEQAGVIGLNCRVTNVPREMLSQAQEVFLCNSLIGIWPVIAVDEKNYRVGEMTRRLQAAAAGDRGEATGWLA